MVIMKNCIWVVSDMNTWIDFCVLVDEEDFENAKQIVEKAYNDWWELPDAQFEPLGDYVSRCLTVKGIVHEMYYKHEAEEET